MEQQKALRAIIVAELLVPLLLLIFGIYHGVLQVMYRAGVIHGSSVAGIDYYQGLTAHGVINALVLTTLFAVALGHAMVAQELELPISVGGAALSLAVMLIGAVMAAAMIFAGKATVLYTFYPPLKASPFFYIGLSLFIVGSWIPLYTWIPPYLRWRKANPGKKTPLAVVGIFTTFIVWQIATLPVAFEVLVLLVPWSMGWTPGVNVVLSRTLFWFFGHPLVYFWLLPTYTLYYTMLPRLAGGKLYSDFAARFSFFAFIVLSSPLGLHHQFADPGISSNWKGLHTVLTLLVVVPSLVTAFTLSASLEHGARSKGGAGLFGWWRKLPHFDREKWLFPYLFLGLVIFIFGGITGIVNASYAMNGVIHNTAWLPAHFHLTVGGPVFLAILGMSLYLITGLLNKRVAMPALAIAVPYIWMTGTFLFSGGLFAGGLRGEPRRTNLGLTYLNPQSPSFRPDWQITTHFALIGGCIMALAVLVYFAVLISSLVGAREYSAAPFSMPMSEPLHDEDIAAVRNFTPWVAAAVLAVVLAYYPPLNDIMKSHFKPVPGYRPDSPIALKAGE
ncbi:MAG TPA: cbb3-type cytochrome c oxidase subunit I [Candidatus Acidoferrales bacterium]|jgi:cytochrome c oxidase subunit 1|nr:cbb3-type cytochrome c oxidase subunit I [Candidatus Acidoferrales bacterium]